MDFYRFIYSINNQYIAIKCHLGLFFLEILWKKMEKIGFPSF